MADPLNVIYETTMKQMAVTRLEAKQRAARAAGREGVVHPYNGLVSKMLTDAEKVLKTRILKRGGSSVFGLLALREARQKPHNIQLKVICAIAARSVVDGISCGHRLQTLSNRIGTRIEDEMRMREFKRREPKLYKWMGQRFKERGSQDYRHKRRTLMAALRRANSDEIWPGWTPKIRAGLGLLVLDAIMRAGFIETISRSLDRPGYTTRHVQLTPEAEEALASADARAHELLQPWFKPMLEPPIDWTDPENGGYVTIDMAIMKTRQREDIERLRAADMPIIYDAINAIQRTAWKINENVLVTAQELRRMGSLIKGLPNLGMVDKPVRPHLPTVGRELNEAETKRLKKYKAARKEWFNADAQRRSRTTQSLQILEIADEIRTQPTIYFPQQLDYRGRSYAVPQQFNPQSNDLSRGLLTFATSRNLGTMGGFWLAFHGANTWGMDKGPLNERVDWVLEHEEEILACAKDPLGCQWWAEADGGNNPWQFLAFCFEWARYVEEGEDYESSLPVSVDGSCNGLQHFSAMLRDPVGAAATNLCATGPQIDIYTEVAKKAAVLAQEQRTASETDRQFAGIWKEFGISRACVKRPVMTTPYGCTAIGMKQMVIDDTIRVDKTGGYFGEEPWAAAQWLAARIYKAIGTTVSASQGAMKFLQEMAKATAAIGLPIGWTSPAGLPVVQHILQQNNFRISTMLLGTVNLRYTETTQELDRGRQKTAIAPNFVHSYDAAHLMLTVVETERQLGRPLSWAMVHDSYGTHAGDLQELGRVLREQFVAIYRDSDPLGDLRERVKNSVPKGTEIAEAPKVGDFDIEEVLKAEFFFS